MRPKILDGYIYCSKKVVVENLLKYTNQLYNYSDGFGGIIRISSTSASAWERTGTALARSKRLNHYPVVATYLWHVR